MFELVAIGDAQLAKAVKNKVFSLDLVACDDSVIACNMAHVSSLSASISWFLKLSRVSSNMSKLDGH